MASLNEMPVITGRRAGVSRMKKHSLKTDMTPMVDLGLLLIAFFVITTELSKPVALQLNMPHDGPPMKLEDSNALTVLIDGNEKIHYYHGNMTNALANNKIFETTFSNRQGIGKIIRDKQQLLDQVNISKEKRNGLMLLIKATDDANYENVIDMLDEALINDVKKYAILKMEPEEKKWLHDHR
jgi:biopolymer transport protein ExbD